jgi:hypothetical protein
VIEKAGAGRMSNPALNVETVVVSIVKRGRLTGFDGGVLCRSWRSV